MKLINFHANYMELPRFVNSKVRNVINFCLKYNLRIIHCEITTVRPPVTHRLGPRPLRVVGFVMRYVGAEPMPEGLLEFGYRYPGDDAIVNHKLAFEVNLLDEWPDCPSVVMNNLSLDDILSNQSDNHQITRFARLRMGVSLSSADQVAAAQAAQAAQAGQADPASTHPAGQAP